MRIERRSTTKSTIPTQRNGGNRKKLLGKGKEKNLWKKTVHDSFRIHEAIPPLQLGYCPSN